MASLDQVFNISFPNSNISIVPKPSSFSDTSLAPILEPLSQATMTVPSALSGKAPMAAPLPGAPGLKHLVFDVNIV